MSSPLGVEGVPKEPFCRREKRSRKTLHLHKNLDFHPDKIEGRGFANQGG